MTGIRRSGKSTLLEAFKHEFIESGVAKRNIVFLNFEERENMYLTNWTALYDEIIKNIKSDKKYYVFLDEVQLVDDFEKLINSLFRKKNIDKEIDFVVQKPNNEREYYQIAFTVNDEKTFEREISAFRNIRDNYPKFLLTLDFDNTSFEGIHKVNVIDWLLGAIHST